MRLFFPMNFCIGTLFFDAKRKPSTHFGNFFLLRFANPGCVKCERFEKMSLIEMFLWTRRNQFWKYQYLSKIVLSELRAILLALCGACFFWSFQPFLSHCRRKLSQYCCASCYFKLLGKIWNFWAISIVWLELQKFFDGAEILTKLNNDHEYYDYDN